jgi:hypothetical protein
VAKKRTTKASRKRAKQRLKRPQRKAPQAVQVNLCPLCQEPAHQGDSEETFDSLVALNPEAAVFFDRDLAEAATVTGLCGPRFRQNSAGLYAHYGSPRGARYVVYQWQPEPQLWKICVDTAETVALPDRAHLDDLPVITEDLDTVPTGVDTADTAST